MEQDVRSADVRPVSTPSGSVKLDGSVDRRRPGRPASVSPALLPLLRGESMSTQQSVQTHRFRGPSDIDPALGVVVSVSIGLALWVAAFLVATMRHL